MIDKLKTSVPVIFQKLEEMDTSDGRFTKVRIWLMHLGLNFNGSIFEKDITEEAFPSLAYIPIVGFIKANKSGEDDFSNHKYLITKKDGETTYTYAGNAYGSILSSADNNAHFEDRLCDDGITRTFVVVDGLLWNQFESSAEIMNKDIVKSHSMELCDDDFEGFEDEDEVFHFTKFSFRAACILGSDYEAGMQNSTIEVQFTMNDFVKNIQSELSNKLNAYSKYIEENAEIKQEEGGIIMAEPEQIIITDYALTLNEQFSEIRNIVSSHEQMRDYWGDSVPKYYVQDIQEDQVICVDREENYTYYGFVFTMDGDKPVIDFESKTRKKTQYVDFIEGTPANEGAFSFAEQIENFEKTVTEKLEVVNTEKGVMETDYSSIKTELDEIKPKYEDFVKQEEVRIENETSLKKDELFTKFDDHLSDVANYVSLKGNKNELSLDEIQKQCAFMFTEKSLSTNFSKKQKTENQLIADIIDPSTDGDGIVQTKYGAIKVGKK